MTDQTQLDILKEAVELLGKLAEGSPRFTFPPPFMA
jgi:hypothetical protein